MKSAMRPHPNCVTSLATRIEGLGNLNECTHWCRYVPLSLASLCPHTVYRSFFRGQSPFRQESQLHHGECRTLYAVCGCSSLLASRRTPALPKWGSRPPHLPVHLTVFWQNVEYPVLTWPWALGIELINRCENLLWLSMHFVAMILSEFVHSHAYDVRYELKIDIPSLVNCNGPVSPEKSEQSASRIPWVSTSLANLRFRHRNHGNVVNKVRQWYTIGYIAIGCCR
jgi:hypothetical protein